MLPCCFYNPYICLSARHLVVTVRPVAQHGWRRLLSVDDRRGVAHTTVRWMQRRERGFPGGWSWRGRRRQSARGLPPRERKHAMGARKQRLLHSLSGGDPMRASRPRHVLQRPVPRVEAEIHSGAELFWLAAMCMTTAHPEIADLGGEVPCGEVLEFSCMTPLLELQRHRPSHSTCSGNDSMASASLAKYSSIGQSIGTAVLSITGSGSLSG